MAHTPGPWHSESAFGDQTVEGPDGFMVADCAVMGLQDGAPSEEQCEANARLIAAAPALLEALVVADRVLRKLKYFGEERDTIIAAIAAARKP